MSSDVEGMPNALMEAMTIGVPSVSTDCPCGGPRFLLSEERGLLSPVGDAAELAKKILILLEDEQQREAYSLRSKTYMMQFRQEIITAKWVDFISSLR
jgi:glycosyltransferase involved in cell wall biosynthesis